MLSSNSIPTPTTAKTFSPTLKKASSNPITQEFTRVEGSRNPSTKRYQVVCNHCSNSYESRRETLQNHLVKHCLGFPVEKRNYLLSLPVEERRKKRDSSDMLSPTVDHTRQLNDHSEFALPNINIEPSHKKRSVSATTPVLLSANSSSTIWSIGDTAMHYSNWSERMEWLEGNVDNQTLSQEMGDVIRPLIFNMDERINIVFSGYERRPIQSRNQEWLIRGISAVAQDIIDNPSKAAFVSITGLKQEIQQPAYA
jgi:hypothetical protein